MQFFKIFINSSQILLLLPTKAKRDTKRPNILMLKVTYFSTTEWTLSFAF